MEANFKLIYDIQYGLDKELRYLYNLKNIYTDKNIFYIQIFDRTVWIAST